MQYAIGDAIDARGLVRGRSSYSSFDLRHGYVWTLDWGWIYVSFDVREVRLTWGREERLAQHLGLFFGLLGKLSVWFD
ncbi:hypothetical protein NW767_015636 [Fusarium falciforme]|nr:hypothetical protein NW767_015636 [Fusarium falciforme]